MSQRWKLTPHARERMEEMGLERRDLLEALVKPVLDYPAGPKYGPTCRVAAAGDLAIPYDCEDRRVITVLWHGKEGR